MMLTVDDEHGQARVVIDQAPNPERLAAVGEVIADVIGDLDRERSGQLLAVLVRMIADEQAYERICHQRGLLL